MASTNDERRAVKHVDGVVLDRNGLPTFVVRGKEYIHVDHAGASYLYSQAALDEAIAAERERWERALKQTWQAIDPLKPAGQPGSYARGYDNGFAAALQVLRGNLGAQRCR